ASISFAPIIHLAFAFAFALQLVSLSACHLVTLSPCHFVPRRACLIRSDRRLASSALSFAPGSARCAATAFSSEPSKKTSSTRRMADCAPRRRRCLGRQPHSDAA